MTYTYNHNEYTLVQTSYNWHYMIFDSKGHMVMHAQCRKKLSKEEAVGIIEAYLSMYKN